MPRGGRAYVHFRRPTATQARRNSAESLKALSSLKHHRQSHRRPRSVGATRFPLLSMAASLRAIPTRVILEEIQRRVFCVDKEEKRVVLVGETAKD